MTPSEWVALGLGAVAAAVAYVIRPLLALHSRLDRIEHRLILLEKLILEGGLDKKN